MNNSLLSVAQSEQLSLRGKQLFAACLIQRLLPNYLLFCDAFDAGDSNVAKSIVDVVWEKIALPMTKINMEAQLAKLEDITPNIDDYDNYGVFPANDFCVALGELLENFENFSDDMVVALSHISSEGIISFLEVQGEDLEQLSMNELWQEEAFYQREVFNRLYDLELAQGDFKAHVKSLREYSRNDGVSNIGISLDDM
jgi:uncharacterized protein YjaG (DUF416 family)